MTEDDEFEVDEAMLAALEVESPILSRVRRFAESLGDIDWFAHLGEAPAPKVRAAALAYLDQLGFPDAELAIIRDYEDAAEAAETHDWAAPAWETEELLRADLTGRALGVLSEEALDLGLSLVAKHAGEAAREAAADQAALWDMADEASLNLAVGAAAQAAHGAALALIAAADGGEPTDEHPFVTKFRLFELGRWPVALIGGSFSLF